MNNKKFRISNVDLSSEQQKYIELNKDMNDRTLDCLLYYIGKDQSGESCWRDSHKEISKIRNRLNDVPIVLVVQASDSEKRKAQYKLLKTKAKRNAVYLADD